MTPDDVRTWADLYRDVVGPAAVPIGILGWAAAWYAYRMWREVEARFAAHIERERDAAREEAEAVKVQNSQLLKELGNLTALVGRVAGPAPARSRSRADDGAS